MDGTFSCSSSWIAVSLLGLALSRPLYRRCESATSTSRQPMDFKAGSGQEEYQAAPSNSRYIPKHVQNCKNICKNQARSYLLSLLVRTAMEVEQIYALFTFLLA